MIQVGKRVRSPFLAYCAKCFVFEYILLQLLWNMTIQHDCSGGALQSSVYALCIQVEGRTNPWLSIRGSSMYFYINYMWARAEELRNRNSADMQVFRYPPIGDPNKCQQLQHILVVKDDGHFCDHGAFAVQCATNTCIGC